MTPDDVLVIKSFDSEGVIGRSCPARLLCPPQPEGGAAAQHRTAGALLLLVAEGAKPLPVASSVVRQRRLALWLR